MFGQPMMYATPMQIPSYQVHNFKVFFGNQYLPQAEWVMFKDLGQGYGKLVLDWDNVR